MERLDNGCPPGGSGQESLDEAGFYYKDLLDLEGFEADARGEVRSVEADEDYRYTLSQIESLGDREFETVTIKNVGSSTVSLTGWMLSTSARPLDVSR